MTTGKVEEPYLILHKVRGQPALDIAIKIMIGEEEGWIIPTSGHRAYPHRTWPVSEYQKACALLAEHNNDPDWVKAPDHYRTASAPKTNLRELLAKIVKPVVSNFKKRAI